MRSETIISLVLAAMLAAAATAQQQTQPEAVRQGQQLVRQGKLAEALDLYRQAVHANPDSWAVYNAAGQALDLAGRGADAREHFEKAASLAPDARAKAQVLRNIAISWAFEGDCKNTGKYEQQVIDYWAMVPDFYQQGEMADEAGRVCIDVRDLDAAREWYRKGRDLGLKQPDITAARKALWDFRWEHAQARLAARKGDQAEAHRHAASAQAALEGMKPDAQLYRQQAGFVPYLSGYLAFYSGNYQAAIEELQKDTRDDPFVQCLIGQAYEKLGRRGEAMESYRKAAAATAHNPPTAYARPFARRKLV
jgi:Flp pilus assembly protein TadD